MFALPSTLHFLGWSHCVIHPATLQNCHFLYWLLTACGTDVSTVSTVCGMIPQHCETNPTQTLPSSTDSSQPDHWGMDIYTSLNTADSGNRPTTMRPIPLYCRPSPSSLTFSQPDQCEMDVCTSLKIADYGNHPTTVWPIPLKRQAFETEH